MSKKSFIVYFFFLSNIIAFGQSNYINYYNKCNEAEYRLLCNNIPLAKQIYLDAFKLVKKPYSNDLYMMARCYAIENKFDSAYIYLEKAANSVFISFKGAIMHDTAWGEMFLLHPDYKVSLIKIDSIKYEKDLNSKTCTKKYKKSEYFLKEDQKYRNSFAMIQSQYDTSSQIYKAALTQLLENDDKVQKEIIKYVKRHGYPGLFSCQSDIIGVVLVHFRYENVQLIKPLLLKEIDEGKIFPMEIAPMIDRIEYAQKKKCGFSYFSNEFCTENDWPEIIKRRLELGLGIYLGGYGRGPAEKRPVLPWVGKLIK